MAATVTKAGPYYSSGQIKFSDLRRDFRANVRKTTSGGSETTDSGLNSGSISASELLRNTSTSETSPVVPDCTENRQSGPSNTGITDSQSNWKVSHFRNSIKYYYIAQSETDTNFDIDAQTWNTNLNKNIVKFMFVDGTCGSNTTLSPAAEHNATAYNLTIDVYGNILGCGGGGGGTGGNAPAISGEAGGDALSMLSSGGNNISVLVRSGAKIYGGGGGGEKGATGATGGGGKCVNTTTQSGCGSAPGCPGGYSQTGEGSGGCCQTYSYCCGLFNCGCTACSQYTKYRYCKQEYDTSGGNGGAGGNGGPGRGYNIQTGSLAGASGSAGASGGGCGAQNGGTGETGAAGGEWATAGGNTTNSGNGGGVGKAITGSNYSVTGTINSSTVKGAFNP